MFKSTRRSVRVLLPAVALTLLMATAVLAGVLPRVGGEAAAVAPSETPATVSPSESPSEVPPPKPPAAPKKKRPGPTAPAAETTAPPAASPSSGSVSGSGASTGSGTSGGGSTPAAKPSPKPTKTSTGSKVARRTPTAPEVQAVITEINRRIPLYRPTQAQALDFADDVCDAFDGGQTYGQVAATVKAKLGPVSFLGVGSDDIRYAVTSAVTLVCPGHSPKL